MKNTYRIYSIAILIIISSFSHGQTNSSNTNNSSSDNPQSEAFLSQSTIDNIDQKARIDTLRKKVVGYPVVGVMEDTLFLVYTKIGASTPLERSTSISKKINTLYEDDFINLDSIVISESDFTHDIIYGKTIIMSVSESDAVWYGKDRPELSVYFQSIIKTSISEAKEKNSLIQLILRIGLVILVLIFARIIIWAIGKGYDKLLAYINSSKEKWLKNLSYKDYTFLTVEQELQAVLLSIKILRWVIYALLLYISLPIVFSIFPFSRDWADQLINLLLEPLKSVFNSVWNYLPNLFSILVIFIVMKYFIRFVQYIFHEIELEKLKISGFHADWAKPTFSIIKFLLYAFLFVLIFPYLPGSDSNIFKGVSVFIGVLFSLGSSSAIANIISGLVITYMRPFKIGDRIKIGDATGDVIEKTLLVTRVRTIKNEVITIPNSAVLTGNTINYTSEAKEKGLIIHTTVTIGYDIPWKDMHTALIDAALKTGFVLKDPKPFVLQTSLDDFYVSYQINAYTKEASKQALIYSNLYENIQDICNERNIEILSPHYRSARDGNHTTIPANYLSKDYQPGSFKVSVDKEK